MHATYPKLVFFNTTITMESTVLVENADVILMVLSYSVQGGLCVSVKPPSHVLGGKSIA
jgi:hypothetical protein